MLDMLTTAATEPVRATLWDIAQQAASFALTIVSLTIIVGPIARKLWKSHRAKRAREEQQRREERVAEITEQIDRAVQPMRERLEQIHRTTHVNGGKSSPPTLKDDICLLRGDVKGLISSVAMNTARQVAAEERGRETYEAARAALREQGIELPGYDD